MNLSNMAPLYYLQPASGIRARIIRYPIISISANALLYSASFPQRSRSSPFIRQRVRVSRSYQRHQLGHHLYNNLVSWFSWLSTILCATSVNLVCNYPFNPIYHKCALDLEHETAGISVKQDSLRMRRRKRTLSNLKIYPYYDESFELQKESFLYKAYIIEPAIEYLHKALQVRNPYDNIKLQRKCVTNRLAFVKINGEFSHYCVDGCAPVTTCGDVRVPDHHLMGCRRILNSKLVRLGTEGPGISGGVDFVLYIESRHSRKCEDPSVLAYASSCQSEAQLDRPIAGSINFCPGRLSTDFGHLSQSLFIAKHELLHALGFAVTQFAFYRRPSGEPYTRRNALTGRPDLGFLNQERSNIYAWSQDVTTTTKWRWQSARGYFLKNVTLMVLPTVVAEARRYFNCSSMVGLELEDQGGLGVAITHWEKRILENDIMTATFTQEARVSRITLALMYDTGWYIPNYAMADNMAWGKNLGCDFLEMSCYEFIQDRLAKSQSIEPFCVIVNRPEEELSGFCSADRHAYAYCNLEKHQFELELQHRYFTDDQIPQAAYYGGKSTVANYCPYPQEFNWYKGEKVSRTTQCHEFKNNQEMRNNFLLQEFGLRSSCFTLSKNWLVYSCGKRVIPNVVGAGCYQFSCSHSFGLIVTVSNQTYQCPSEGDIIAIEESNEYFSISGALRCPRCLDYCPQSYCTAGAHSKLLPYFRSLHYSERDNSSNQICKSSATSLIGRFEISRHYISPIYWWGTGLVLAVFPIIF